MPKIYHRVVRVLYMQRVKQDKQDRAPLPPALPCCCCCPFISLGILWSILILLAITAMIIISLIPIYLPQKSIRPICINGIGKETSYFTEAPSTIPVGPLTTEECAQLSVKIQSKIDSDLSYNGTVTVKAAEIIYANESLSKRTQQEDRKKLLHMILILCARTYATQHNLQIHTDDLFEGPNPPIIDIVNQTSSGGGVTPSTTIGGSIIPVDLLSSTIEIILELRQESSTTTTESSRLFVYKD